MGERQISGSQIAAYGSYLRAEERSPGTVEKYLRDVRAFARWLGGRPVTKELAAGWKEHLLEQGYAPVTINAMLTALNRFFAFAGWDACHVKFLKIQRRLFRDDSRELTARSMTDCWRRPGEQGRERLTLLLETICATASGSARSAMSLWRRPGPAGRKSP